MFEFPLKTWLTQLPMGEQQEFRNFCIGKDYSDDTRLTMSLFNKLLREFRGRKKKK